MSELVPKERASCSFLEKMIHTLADWCVSNSHHERIFWQTTLPRLKNKVTAIYNSVDLERFTPRDAEKPFVNKILVIGSVSHHKNGLCVIRAMKHLKEKNKLNFSLTWVGQIVLTIPERKAYYEQMVGEIEAAELQNHWNWHEPTSDIHTLMHQYDALILASLTEGLPNVACEALSSGLPVIISNILDHPKLVEDGERGFTFHPQQPEELANKIESLYTLDQEELAAMRKAARKFAAQEFIQTKVTDSYLHIFNQITNK